MHTTNCIHGSKTRYKNNQHPIYCAVHTVLYNESSDKHPGYIVAKVQHRRYNVQIQHPGYNIAKVQHPGYNAQIQHPGYNVAKVQHPGYNAENQHPKYNVL